MRKAVLWATGLVLLTVIAAGCASIANEAPVDEKAQVKVVAEKWAQAIQAKNVDAVVALLSPTFSSSEFGDYKEFPANLKGFVDEGNLDNAKVDLTKAEIVVEDDKATVYPVAVEGGFGTVTLRLALVEEKGQWHIAGFEQG